MCRDETLRPQRHEDHIRFQAICTDALQACLSLQGDTDSDVDTKPESDWPKQKRNTPKTDGWKGASGDDVEDVSYGVATLVLTATIVGAAAFGWVRSNPTFSLFSYKPECNGHVLLTMRAVDDSNPVGPHEPFSLLSSHRL